MKFALLFSIVFAGLSGSAWVSTPHQEKPHQFVFRMKTETQKVEKFEFSSTAPTYEQAFEVAAKACYQHFKDGKRLTEDRGLDIIDVCANPRSL